MSSDMSGFDDYAYETVAGQCAVVAALVIALHDSGVMPLQRYNDALHQLWLEMPEQEAVGESGAVIERMLDLLAARAVTAVPPGDEERTRGIPAFARKPGNRDAMARPAPTPLKALLQALRRPGRQARRRDGRDRFSVSESGLP